MAKSMIEWEGTEKILGDWVYYKQLSSGLKCYIIPKVGYGEKMAALCVHYGAGDVAYKNQQGKEIITPLGTAHFIEHKLFEQSWGDAFSAFGSQGASANAFTDFQKTAYYFSCQEQFEENFRLLLQFVQNPHFTKEGTEKEKNIIKSEITMYEDDPSWTVYFNLLKAMYEKNPIRNPVAGTCQTVDDVTEQTLQDTYDAFYTPDNFSLVVLGDIQPDWIVSVAEEEIKPGKEKATTVSFEESEKISTKEVIVHGGVSQPIFHVGFRHKPPTKEEALDKTMVMRLALDVLAGETSDYFVQAYEKGYLEEPLGFDYIVGKNYAMTAFSGKGDHTREAAELLRDKIEELKQTGVQEEHFERIKKKHLGRMMRGLNSINAICMSQLEFSAKDSSLAQAFAALKRVQKNMVETVIRQDFSEENMVFSVVKSVSS